MCQPDAVGRGRKASVITIAVGETGVTPTAWFDYRPTI
jgi:hypothetical protein